MKFSILDRSAMVGAFITMVLCFGYAINAISTGIEEAGGVSQIMVDAGKELKEISAEIDAYEPTEK